MHALDVLGEPARRRVVEVLAEGSRPAGEIAEVLHVEFGMSQPAASRHLRVLKDAGVVESRIDAQRRMYSLKPEAVEDVAAWTQRITAFWNQRLDALETEIARGKAARRKAEAHTEGNPGAGRPHSPPRKEAS
ncbi:helix-turn-helix transcriptional regulator [Nesterenkonia sp. MY13]|uniref:Helix-turn-helix transcriptional regulator n=1 Tax=Nesterenkonia sedimenti TaxID=1463632 RepID=A0A7X8TGV8_9MICC|nr:metalloregulator ArsR/SmtB family transcription factor [Nesterenkonia sedimenti]NLS08465.1 helix-turn-helix transcriptional regulator [Nesterenkonia sedimenti]